MAVSDAMKVDLDVNVRVNGREWPLPAHDAPSRPEEPFDLAQLQQTYKETCEELERWRQRALAEAENRTEIADEVINHTSVRLSFGERLRVLLHGRVEVRTATPTADVVTITGPTRSDAWAPRLIPRRRRGYAESATNSQRPSLPTGPRPSTAVAGG